MPLILGPSEAGGDTRERSDTTNASEAYWATIGGMPHSAAVRVFGQDGVEVRGCKRCRQSLAVEVDRDVADVIGQAPEHPAHASLLPRACLGMIDLEHPTGSHFSMKTIGPRIASGTEEHDLRRAFTSGGQGSDPTPRTPRRSTGPLPAGGGIAWSIEISDRTGSAGPGQVTHRCRDLRGVGQFLMADVGQFKLAVDISVAHGGRRRHRRRASSPFGRRFRSRWPSGSRATRL